jgi:hypothetical protein
MARALALLFATGGGLVLLTLALPHAEDLDRLGVAIPPLLALIVAGILNGLGAGRASRRSRASSSAGAS